MPGSTKEKRALATAAAGFEDELARYVEIVDELSKNPVNTQKGLVRAKHALEESAACEQRMSERIQALSEAMIASRTQQETCAAKTLEAAQRFKERSEQLGALMDRFCKLGEQARAVQEPFSAAQAAQEGHVEPTVVISRLKEVATQIETIVVEAESIEKDAKASDFSDVARDAGSLRQQVQSTRNKVALVLQRFAATAPS